MTIGILTDQGDERRVPLIPEHIKTISNLNCKVIVEKSAGESAFVSDDMYKDAGAEIKSRKEVETESDLLLFVDPPSDSTINKLGKDKIIIGTLNPLTDKGLIQTLNKAGLTTFSMDLVPRITRAQSMDVLSSMASVAGYRAVLDAARLLPKFFPMSMTAAGTIKPARMLILGAGVAGLQAVATARKLGAIVEVFDVRSAVKEEVMSLGGKFIEVEGATEDKTAGGYAVEQTDDFKERQAQMIHDHAVKADVIICTAQIPGRKAPLLIKQASVEGMKPGSVIIDLAASSGGNCEVTKNNEISNFNGVVIVGESNYASTMPSDSSLMYGTNLLNFIKLIINEDGSLNLNFDDEIVKGTCLTHNGELVNERVKSILNS
jgi:NAD(P) transhydrogenase subunit alpha